AMDDDFNTGGAIGELFELAKLANKYCDDHRLEEKNGRSADATAVMDQLLTLIKELSNVLGLFVTPPADAGGGDELLDRVMPLVIDLRAMARAGKNFAVADAVRNGLESLGIVLEDRSGGTEWSGGDDDALQGVVQLLIELRHTARAEKDFAAADEIRDRLAEAGVALEDRAGGTEWSRS
ncbi:MAG: DALR domain-containing protein, partial [Planctomycetota bacterium]